jgi:hypothetical protein
MTMNNPTIATLLSFEGIVPSDNLHQCALQLDELRSAVKGIYASVGAVGDSGAQQILVVGSADDGAAVETLLTSHGLECFAKRICPEFVREDGEPNEIAIWSRLLGRAPIDYDAQVDYPHSNMGPRAYHFNEEDFPLVENPDAGLIRALANRS